MRNVLYFCMDLIDYSLLGVLLAYLLEDMLSERFSWQYSIFKRGSKQSRNIKASWLMCLQFAAVRQFLSYSQWVKQMLYGKEMYIVSSKQSIVPVAVSMGITLVVGMILYKGGKMKLLSLVAAFYALLELTRFSFYPIVVGSFDWIVGYYNHLYWDLGAISSERYQQLLGWVEFVWNFVVMALVFALLLFCILKYKRYLMSVEGTGAECIYDRRQGKRRDTTVKVQKAYQSREEALLFVPELMGLVFTVMLRSILFYYNKKIYSIIEDYPELNLIIPSLSLLCIISILLSGKMFSEVKIEHEKRRQAELYQISVEELEAHVCDMESVQTQIRGMKHDLKNYIADINALLAQMASGDEQAKEEVHRYVDSIQASLEKLDRKYQTKNPVTDVILGRYERLAEDRGISFSSEFIYPENLGIDVFDISIILNNALENAFEACEKETKETYIALYAKQKGKMFLITVENSFTGTLKWIDGIPCSMKPGDGHGLGLKNIKNCAEKYYGRVEIETKENRYYLTVMLQGSESAVL